MFNVISIKRKSAPFVWYCDVSSRNGVLSNEMAIGKAEVFGKILHVTSFAYSRGWLARFKLRLGISRPSIIFTKQDNTAEYLNHYW